MPGASCRGVTLKCWPAAAAIDKTPSEVVARLNDAMVKALRSPDVRDRLTAIGFDVVASTPEEFGQFMKNEVERWTRVVQRGGIKPDCAGMADTLVFQAGPLTRAIAAIVAA